MHLCVRVFLQIFGHDTSCAVTGTGRTCEVCVCNALILALFLEVWQHFFTSSIIVDAREDEQIKVEVRDPE